MQKNINAMHARKVRTDWPLKYGARRKVLNYILEFLSFISSILVFKFPGRMKSQADSILFCPGIWSTALKMKQKKVFRYNLKLKN